MSEIRIAKPYTADLSMLDDINIMTLWKLGWTTQNIATRLRRPEWQIANRLLHLREETRGTGNAKASAGSDA